MEVSSLDHLVLTVRDVEATVTFYERALGMRGFSFAGDRRALAFGDRRELVSVYVRDPDGNLVEISNPTGDPAVAMKLTP